MISQDRKTFARSFFGKTVLIQIDRPIGSIHPKYTNIAYPLNYGYLPNVLGGDGEELDVYLLGIDIPVEEYTAEIIGVIYRHNDTEDKLIAAPCGRHFTLEEIKKYVHFQEKYFESEIELNELIFK